MGGVLFGEGKQQRGKSEKKIKNACTLMECLIKKKEVVTKKRAVARYKLVKKMVKRLKSSGGANTRGKR